MTPSRNKRQIPVDEVAGNLEKSFGEVDKARAAGLGELAALHETRLNVLARDQKRLEEKLGKQDPRVAALTRSIELGKQTVAELRLEQAASAVREPEVDAKSWALHGRVLNAKREPQKGLTVALYQGDAFLSNLGIAATDGAGYFLLLVKEADPALQNVSVRVLREGQVIHEDPRPAAVNLGHAEYRDIVLDDNEVIPTPPRSSPRGGTTGDKKTPSRPTRPPQKRDIADEEP